MLRLLATAAAFWVASQIVPGISYSGSALALIIVAAVFGIVNALIGTIVKLLSLPLIFLTLGLFALVINALMLLLTTWVATQINIGLRVDGFVPAFLGSLVISIVSSLVVLVFDDRKKKG